MVPSKSVIFLKFIVLIVIRNFTLALNIPLTFNREQLLEQSSAYISHNNELVVSDEPECNNENHRAKIVILPVLVPHNMGRQNGGGGTQIKILPMNQIPIIIKAKRGSEGPLTTTIVDSHANQPQPDHHPHSRDDFTNYQSARNVRTGNHGRQTLWPFQKNFHKITITEEKPEGVIIDADYSSSQDSPNIKLQKMRGQDLPILSQLLLRSLNQKEVDWDYFNK